MPRLAAPIVDYDALPAYRERISQITDAVRAEARRIFAEVYNECIQEANQRGSFEYLRQLGSASLGSQIFSRVKAAVCGATASEKLVRDGCLCVRIPAQDKAELLRIAGPMVRAAETKVASVPANIRKFSDNNIVAPAAEQPDLTTHVVKVLSDTGVMEAVQSYWGRDTKPKLFAVQINDADNSNYLYSSRFAPTNLKPGKASYLHVDSDFGCSLKVLIYLTEVEQKTGPFSYVLGSNRHIDTDDLLIRKATDKAGAKLDLDRFLALPPEHRRRTHFGFELPDDHPSTKVLLKHERSFTSADGDLLCFDYNGIHRGGMVSEGRRIILQVLLK